MLWLIEYKLQQIMDGRQGEDKKAHTQNNVPFPRKVHFCVWAPYLHHISLTCYKVIIILNESGVNTFSIKMFKKSQTFVEYR